MYRKLGPSFVRSTEMQRSNEIGAIIELDDPETEYAFRRSMRTQKQLTLQVGSIIDAEDPETAVEFKRLVRLADLAIDPGLRNQVQAGLKQILAGVDINRVLDRIATASVPTKRAPIQVGTAGPALDAPRSAGGAMKRARAARQSATPRQMRSTSARAAPAEGHEAYPKLKCPNAVLAGTEFELEVGLSPTADGDDVALADLPPLGEEPYVVTVQLDAPGFECRAGDSLRQRLAVSKETPYPVHVVHLVARASADDAPRVIEAAYYIGSDRVGRARRRLKVVAVPDDIAGVRVRNPKPKAPLDTPSVHPADLTIEITVNETTGVLRWDFHTIHADLQGIPDRVAEVNWGGKPEAFVRDLITELETADPESIDQTMEGIGKKILKIMPEAADKVLGSLGSVTDDVPRVLLISNETLIPWELAAIGNPISDAPPYLGAQVVLGRWVHAVRQPPPSSRPPESIVARQLAVISGTYKTKRLVHAEAEAAHLEDAFHGEHVGSTQREVASFFRKHPAHNIIHYSGHAKHGNEANRRGLRLTDESYYSDTQILATSLSGTPLIFINACQAGVAYEVLGNYGGLVDSFLNVGAGALVAPLWSVDDKEAQVMAEAFYAAALPGATGKTSMHPAAILRERRAQFVGSDGTHPSATLMAYQFYGHPNLLLDRGLD